MNRDIQKPILYKADPYVFAQIEAIKDSQYLNRNRFINDAVTFYIKLVKTLTNMELINDITWENKQLQELLKKNCKEIQRGYRRIY